MSTGTLVLTSTDVLTRAQINHFGSKIGGEIRTLFVRSSLWTELYAEQIRDDVCLWLLRGYAERVSLQLKRSGTGEIVFELAYRFSPWDGISTDQPGRGYTRPDVSGLEACVRVTKTSRFQALSTADRQLFYDALQIKWGDGGPSEYAKGGAWVMDDRFSVKEGQNMIRSSFSVGA